jgi:glyoxylase-like metal-dependent hydrolase (beta-lactamase superfamily II)
MLEETRNWYVQIFGYVVPGLTVIQQLAQPEFKDKPIIGGKDCEGVTKTPAKGEVFEIGDIKVTALYTPCHTQDSICYFMTDSTGGAVFTGDTLFHGGMYLLGCTSS